MVWAHSCAVAQLVDEDLLYLNCLKSIRILKACARCCPANSDRLADSVEHVLKNRGPDRQEKYDEADAAPETSVATTRTLSIRSSGAGVKEISAALEEVHCTTQFASGVCCVWE